MVGFKVGFFWYQIGSADLLYAFFSTVAYNLENGDWGSRFPVIMTEAYTGKLLQTNIDEAIKELNTIRKELQSFSPENVVWEIEDLSKQPPWKNDISKDITDLSNYFVTSDGENLIQIFIHALKKAKELNTKLQIYTI